MKSIYKKDLVIEADYVDCESTYDILGMLSQMQNVISEHTVDLGVDFPTITAKSNAFWVVLKTGVKIFKQPKWNEKVSISTYPLPPSLVRCDRECVITDEKGELVALSVGEWCILDHDTKKPRKVSTSCYPFELDHVKDRRLPERAKRVVYDFAPDDLVYERVIRVTDMDLNYHTNNKSYTRFALDAFPSSLFKTKTVSEYQINFENQSYENETIQIFVHELEPDKYVIGGINKADCRRIFTSEMTLKLRSEMN